MNEVITQITFSTAPELRDAIANMIKDAFQLGHSGHRIGIRPGVIELVERTLTDGSKVVDIAIAQVGN